MSKEKIDKEEVWIQETLKLTGAYIFVMLRLEDASDQFPNDQDLGAWVRGFLKDKDHKLPDDE
jgi:hypothetical protein